MSYEGEYPIDEEIEFKDYLFVLIQRWWVVVSVFILIVGGTVIYLSSLPDVYEARTKLLIVAPISERLITDKTEGDDRLPINPFLGTNLSVGTLSALGTANDLLQLIISDLDLRDNSTQQLWAVERLASMITVSVETAGTGGTETSLPLLTMTIRGEDPETLRR